MRFFGVGRGTFTHWGLGVLVFEHSGVEAWAGVGAAFVFMRCAGGSHICRSVEWQHTRGQVGLTGLAFLRCAGHGHIPHSHSQGPRCVATWRRTAGVATWFERGKQGGRKRYMLVVFARTWWPHPTPASLRWALICLLAGTVADNEPSWVVVMCSPGYG